MKKGYTVNQVKRMLIDMAKVKMPVHLYCICGFPGETQEDSKETIGFLKEHITRYHSIYFQDYDSQLAHKVFTDELDKNTEGYNTKQMITTLMKDPEVTRSFAVHGNLMRKQGYPFIEDHNFLYLVKEFGLFKKNKNYNLKED